MASVAPMPNAGLDVGKPGQQLLPGYVVKLLKTLKIPFGTDRTMSGVDVDPTIMLINHVIDCLGALRDINKVYRAKGSLASRSVGTRVMFGFTAELGNILLDSINFEPPKDLSDSSLYYGQIAGSILGVFPEIAAQVTPSTGKVLIHHTALKCSSTMAMESMKLVVKAFPAGAWTADRTGALPLHWVTHNPNCTQEMVNFLVNANPKGPWVADMDGYLPLHWAVNQDIPNLDVIAALIAANASASAKACSKGSLPLHWCVNRPQPHIGVMRALLQVHPDGVRTFDKTGWLPIHQCVNRSEISLDALQLLIELYPQGLQCPNVNGQLPIHRTLDQNPPNAEAIHMMLESFPGSAKVADDEGYLPLHLALDCARPNPFIAKILLEQYPESAFHKSKDGLLPLHCIISSMTPVIEIIEMLLKIFPDSTESMAVDVVPIDEMADPETWEGEWMEKRWTPLSRAIDRGLDAIVMLFRDALNGTKFNGTHLHNGPSGPSNATARHHQPQSAPPINNLMDTQFANIYHGGPSTSSNDFMTRNLNTGSLVLGGNLDSPSRGAPDDYDGNDYDGHGGPSDRPPQGRATNVRPIAGPTLNSVPVPLRERAPGGMGPNPGLSRAPSMSDLKIRGSEQRDKEREHRESRRPGTGGDKAGGDRDHRRRESSAARRDHHRRESRREDSTDREHGRDDSRRHSRRSSSRKAGEHRGHGQDGRGSRDRHHSRTRDSDNDYVPSETSEAINDDGGGERGRPHSSSNRERGHHSKHSSSKHRREHRPQERIYENDYEQEYDNMEAQPAAHSPGNLSERGPGGRHPKLKLMSGGGAIPPSDAPPRSLLEAAIGRPKTQRGVGGGGDSTAIDINESREHSNILSAGAGGSMLPNKLSIDEIV